MKKETTTIVLIISGAVVLLFAVYFIFKPKQESTNPLTALIGLGTGLVNAL